MKDEKARIVVVDDNEAARKGLARSLQALGFDAATAEGGADGLRVIETFGPDVVLLDLNMPDMDGFTVLERIHEKQPRLPVILVTADERIDSAVEAIRRGAFHYVPKPVDMRALRVTIRRALEAGHLKERVRTLEERLGETKPFDPMVGVSPAIRKAREMAARVAMTDATVLITGESGTGKELLAEGIHRASGRRGGPYVVVNCTALPEGLLENELFGHEAGAFTDAGGARSGKFEQANGGTLLLDEIGDMAITLQPKILRVLENHEVQRLGSEEPSRVDVRFVASTNRDLDQAVADGRFRSDLFFRINVVRINLPPLRERAGDVPLLATHFLKRACRKYGVQRDGFEPEAMECLERHHWPGNARELENAIERATILGAGPKIRLEDFEGAICPHHEMVAADAAPLEGGLPLTLAELERRHILAVLKRNHGNQSKTARDLGVKRGTLIYRMKKLGVEVAPH